MKKIVSFKDLKCLSNYELWRSGWENKNEIDVFSYISYEIRPEDLLILGKLVFLILSWIGGGNTGDEL